MTENALDVVAELITETARTIRRETAGRLDVPGVTPGRLRVLRMLEERGTSRMGELADVLGMAPRSLTTVADELSALGLVTRSADPDDRRATLVNTTSRGSQLVQEAEKARTKIVAQIFAGLSPNQVAELEALLSKAASPKT